MDLVKENNVSLLTLATQQIQFNTVFSMLLMKSFYESVAG